MSFPLVVLDGQASINALVDKAMADGMPALAITDHGNMFGIKEFFNYDDKSVFVQARYLSFCGVHACLLLYIKVYTAISQSDDFVLRI